MEQPTSLTLQETTIHCEHWLIFLKGLLNKRQSNFRTQHGTYNKVKENPLNSQIFTSTDRHPKMHGQNVYRTQADHCQSLTNNCE